MLQIWTDYAYSLSHKPFPVFVIEIEIPRITITIPRIEWCVNSHIDWIFAAYKPTEISIYDIQVSCELQRLEERFDDIALPF